MKSTFYICLLFALFLCLCIFRVTGTSHTCIDDGPPRNITGEINDTNISIELMEFILVAIREEGLNATEGCVIRGEGYGIYTPPGAARAYKLVAEAIYNSWTRYTSTAEPTVPSGQVERMTPADLFPGTSYETEKKKAMILSAYMMIDFLLPERTALDNISHIIYERYGVDTDEITDAIAEERHEEVRCEDYLSSSRRVAYLLTSELIEIARHDGSNQQNCYADTGNFYPSNPPTVLNNLTTIQQSRMQNIHRFEWSQIVLYGEINTPLPFMMPHAGRMLPFAISPGKYPNFTAPPLPPTHELHNLFVDLLDYQYLLGGPDEDRLKLNVEYWSDGPRRTLNAGHWLEITEEVLRRTGASVDTSVVTFFILTQGLYDAAIGAWEEKRYFDSVRPATYIPLFVNQAEVNTTIINNQFRGLYCPFGPIDIYQWRPYQLPYVITPPFPEYVSAHSTFGYAAATVLALWFGSDVIPDGPNGERGFSVIIKRGESSFEYECSRNGTNLEGRMCVFHECEIDNRYNSENNYSPKEDTELGPWYSYSEAALAAGYSRIYGGLHTTVGHEEGKNLGMKIGETVYDKAIEYIQKPNPASSY